ncbi:MAG TPA: LegC family aminotransferase [Gaiellaceae bacterium]|nr:LegC family aminotransferase [Gaiellaceae bacterium]
MTAAGKPEPFIPLAAPELGGREWEYVKECLDSGWVSSAGPFVTRFEEAVAAYVGAPSAVATVNGTAALHVALLLAGVCPGDEVIMPTLTFIAPANAVRYAGGTPVFIDCDPSYLQIDPEKLSHFVERSCTWGDGALINSATGRRVRAILAVHAFGHPVDLAPVLEIARSRELVVVEDCAESLGARYRGEMTGCFGDVACFSFNGNKVVTAGGAGMVVTGHEAWAERARYLTTQARDHPYEYVHREIGFNYRLTSLNAAVGLAQMELLDEHVAAKRRIAAAYAEALDGVGELSVVGEAPWAFSTFWLSTVLARDATGRATVERLQQRRIEARPIWQPMHLSPAQRGGVYTDCSTAERVYEQGICLPSSVGLGADAQERVIRELLAAR